MVSHRCTCGLPERGPCPDHRPPIDLDNLEKQATMDAGRMDAVCEVHPPDMLELIARFRAMQPIVAAAVAWRDDMHWGTALKIEKAVDAARPLDSAWSKPRKGEAEGVDETNAEDAVAKDIRNAAYERAAKVADANHDCKTGRHIRQLKEGE